MIIGHLYILVLFLHEGPALPLLFCILHRDYETSISMDHFFSILSFPLSYRIHCWKVLHLSQSCVCAFVWLALNPSCTCLSIPTHLCTRQHMSASSCHTGWGTTAQGVVVQEGPCRRAAHSWPRSWSFASDVFTKQQLWQSSLIMFLVILAIAKNWQKKRKEKRRNSKRKKVAQAL